MESLTDSISNRLASKLAKDVNKSSEEYQVLKYGIFVFVHMCLAAIFTFIFGLITNTTFEILIISLIAALMKRYSGGVHSSSPNRCLVTGIFVSYAFVLIAKFVSDSNIANLYIINILILIHSFIIIYTKCPVPSENKPLKREQTRKKLRKNAFRIYLVCCLIFILNVILNKFNIVFKLIDFELFTLCINLGLYMQTLSLTSVGSRIILLIDKLLIIIKI